VKKVTADTWNIEDIVLTSKNADITEGKHFDVQPNFWDLIQNICLGINFLCLSS